jgi:hypothetical protein
VVVGRGELDLGRLRISPSIIAAYHHGVHLPSVKIGCQRLSGQKRTEMMYWPQLCSDEALPGVVGRWGAAVLKKMPIRT